MHIEVPRSISARIVTVFIISFFGITLALFVLHCVLEYSVIKKHMQQDFQRLQSEYQKPLAEAYYRKNTMRVRSLLRGIYNAYAIDGAILESEDGSEAVAIGKLPEKAREYTLLNAPLKKDGPAFLTLGQDFEKREFKLTHATESGQDVLVGRLLVYTNTSMLVDELLDKLLFSGVQALVYFLGVSLVLIYLVRRMVARPLGALAEEMKNVTKEDPEKLVLKAPVQNYLELQTLFSSFNFMLLSFISARKALRSSALAIEERNRALSASERKYRELFENAIEGMFLVSATGEIADANPAFASLLGYASVQEFKETVRNIRTQCFVKPEDFDSILQESKVAFKTCHLDSYFKHKQGTVFPGTLAIRPYWDKDAKVLFFRGSLVDLTERLLKQQAEKEKDAAKIASKAKGEFLAQMSHEIRTPMNGVIGLTRLALASGNPDDQRDLMQHVLKSSQGMMHLLDEILDFSRIEAGMLELEHIEFGLEEIFNFISANLGPEVARKRLELVFDFADTVPMHLVGDPLRLRQVLMNLASNAVKFTETGEIVIRCERLSGDSNKQILEFSVFDTGIGMDEEQQQQLFQAFHQADLSICRKYGGSGLGLVICAKLVENMGGSIEVTSMPGKGSVFSFTAAFGVATTDDVQESPHQEQCLQALSGASALVVDDNSSSGTAVSNMLEKLGIRTRYCATESELLLMLSEKDSRVDYLFVDWNMPQFRESELPQSVGAVLKPEGISVVMVPAFGPKHLQRQVRKGKTHRCLLKPVTPGSLKNCLCAAESSGMTPETPAYGTEGNGLPPSQRTKELNILLVEDNDVNVKVARRTLEILGCRVRHVSTGQEALDAVRTGSFDMIFMDIQLPGMSGYEAARAIRARHQELPIIALTAHAFAKEREKSLAAGMNEHLCKPLDPIQLQSTLRKWAPVAEDGAHSVEAPLETTAPQQKDAPLNLPGIDMNDAQRRMMGDWSLLLESMRAFQREFLGFPEKLSAALAAKEQTRAADLVHALKGAAANISAETVRQLSVEIEKKIRASEDSTDLMESLTRELDIVVDSLRTLEESELG